VVAGSLLEIRKRDVSGLVTFLGLAASAVHAHGGFTSGLVRRTGRACFRAVNIDFDA